MANDYLSEDEVAAILRLKRSTLMKNRYIGKNHPPYVKIGGRILYPRKELERWLKGQPLHTEVKAG